MNDFHILSICIQNKDVAGAMRVLRDKSEFAVRKILEKLKVRVTSQTGRVFWHSVQGWLLTACRLGSIQHESAVPDAFHNLQKTGQPSPAALDMIKLVALLAMLIEHINTLFLTPAWPVMYALGRMAFPLFTLIWAMNVQRSPERLQVRANRLWIWAVITQPVFSLAFLDHQPWWAMNILFVFAGVTQLLALRYRYGQKGNLVGGLLLALMIFPLQPASYGLSGVILAVSLATVTGSSAPEMKRRAAFVAVLSLLCLNGITHLLSMPAETLLLATLPTLVFPLIAMSLCTDLCPAGRQRFMPRHFFYMAYTGHLLVLLILEKVW